METTQQVRKAEHGQGLVEYALILVLVAVVVIVLLSVTGKSVAGVFCTVTSTIDKTIVCGGTLTATTYAVTSNQYRVYVKYNGVLQDGATISCTGSGGSIEAHNDGGGSYVATLSGFHGSISCNLSYSGATGSFTGNFS